MRKVCIVGDCHFDISESLLDSQLRFFKEQLIPYLKENQIEVIIQTGDFHDSRKSTSHITSNKVFDLLENDLKDFEIYIYIGNHDISYKNSLKIHGLQYLKKFPNITIIEEITVKEIYGRHFLFVPWLIDLDDLKKWTLENDSNKIDVCFGHFDVIASKMNKTTFSKTGLQKELLSKFELIISGHYHSKSSEKIGDDSILEFCGSPYQLNFGDSDEERGFHILDCDDMSYKFIENTTSIKFVSLQYPEEVTEEKIKGNIVNVFIDESENIDTDKIQTYIESINRFKPVKEPVKRIFGNAGNKDIDVNELKVKSLKELFDVFVNQIKIEDEIKEDVLKEIDSLYSECQRIE